jgi:hypothetical protein
VVADLDHGHRYRCGVLVSDLRHFLGMPGDAPMPAQRLGLQLTAIVRAASARPTSSGARSAIGKAEVRGSNGSDHTASGIHTS